MVDIAGEPKGDGLMQRIEAGQYPGIVKTTLDGFNQRDSLEGKTDKSARDHFFIFSGRRRPRSATRTGRPAGWILPLVPFNFTLVQNIKRDPFEQAVGIDQKSAMSLGARSAPR